MVTRRVTTLAELSTVAHEVLSPCAKKDSAQVLALRGDLGAGKTAFVKEMGRLLGVHEEITSPTFVIMKSYPISAHQQFKTLIHVDAYRIEDDDEMEVLRFEELLKEKTNFICIEWPEKIQKFIPSSAIKIKLALNTDGTRNITY